MTAKRESRKWELAGWAALVAAFNLPLLAGGASDRFALFPGRLADGEWHLLFTHAFVHVGFYHLLLDAGALLALHAALELGSAWRRIGVVAGGILGSAAATLMAWPAAGETGLCGLSGAAHGLMAVCGIETLGNARLSRAERWVGALTLGIVVAKAAGESVAGRVFFGGWHLGDVGMPVAVCHAGGVVGALAAYAMLRHWRGVAPMALENTRKNWA